MSTTVTLGGNQFIDCASILAVRGEPLLSIRSHPLSITLRTPREWPQAGRVAVTDNTADPDRQDLRVVQTDRTVSVLIGGFPILIAVADQPENIVLRLDLRPLGINVFDDAAGLHVGGNLLSRNRVSNSATAISLA